MKRFLPFFLLWAVASSYAASPPVYQSDIPYRGVNRYGATGDGTTDDTAALQRAITAAASSGDTLYFRGGNTYRIATDLTFPANVTLRFGDGASLKRDNSATVPLNGPIEAPACPIFQNVTAGPGKYTFSASAWEGAVPEWFGAQGDGATDDSTAFAAFFADKPSGAAARFSGKTYALVTAVSLNSMNNTKFLGQAAISDGTLRSSTVFLFNGAPASCITAASSRGLTFEHIQFRYSNASMVGTLINLQKINGGSDTAHIMFNDCSFMADDSNPLALNTAAQLLLLDGTHDIGFSHCTFMGGVYNIKGKVTDTISNTGGYANNAHFDRCGFFSPLTAHVINPDEAWLFENCTFEGTTGHAAGAITFSGGITAMGVTLQSCWIGDDADGTGGAWISWSGGSRSLNLIGCWIGVGSTTTGLLVTGNGCQGINALGNTFFGNKGSSTALDFGATTGHTDFTWLGNSYRTLSQVQKGAIPTGSLYSRGGLLDFNQFLIDTPITAPSVTTPSLTVAAAQPNLLTTDDATFEGGVGDWIASTNAAIAQSGTQALDGSNSLRVTSLGTGMSVAILNPAGVGDPQVVAGQHYYALASFRASTTPDNLELDLYSCNSSNVCTVVSDNNTNFGTQDTTSGWTQLNAQGTMLAGATHAIVAVRFGTAGSASGRVHYVDEVSVNSDSTLVWSAPIAAATYLTANSAGVTATVPMTTAAVNATSITTPTLNVGIPFNPNLLLEDDASFEGGVGHWLNNTNATVAQSGAQFAQGASSLSLTATAGGNEVSARVNTPGWVAVTAGATCYAFASFRAATTVRRVELDVYGYDVSNVFTGVLASTSNGTFDTNSGWTQIHCSGVVPAGTVHVGLVARILDGAGITMSEVHYVDAVQVSVDPSLTWIDPNRLPWATTASNTSLLLGVPLIESVSAPPASAGAAGTTGQIAWGDLLGTKYVFICVAPNTWQRAALSAW